MSDSVQTSIGAGADWSAPGARKAVAARRRRSSLFAVRKGLDKATSTAMSLAFFAVLLVLWSAVSGLGVVGDFFLPSPLAVLTTARQLYFQDGFVLDLAVSIYRVGVGFLLAALIAVPLGLLMGSFQLFRSMLEPCLAFMRYMPATAFIPLLVLWLGIDDAQKFSVIFVGTFFTLTLMVMVSTLSVPIALIESAMMLGASPARLVRKVILPAAKPAIFNDLRIVLGWAWTYIVIAEIVAASSGVGYVILKASRYMDTATIFVGIISIGLVGLTSDLLFIAAGRRLFPYLQRSRS
ncbi:ABC transporter permease [Aminobacter sp. BE322]|uniref:ABC transporter permease n=1 Tax=unclassified Aminobacter TaxID=2644704 RepID=UPI003D1E17BE